MADQPQNFVKELLPRFDVPKDAQSQSICIQCCRHISTWHEHIYCDCKCRVYCSEICAQYDSHKLHTSHNCQTIRDKSDEILANLANFNLRGDGFDIHEYLTNTNSGNMYEFSMGGDDSWLYSSDIKAYFTAREDLVKLLIRDAFGDEHVNTLALDIALMQIKDMFHLDKLDSNYAREDGLSPKKEYLLSLLLFMGKYEEHYNVCCYYAKMGEQFLYWPGTVYNKDHHPYNIIPATRAEGANMTSSFFDKHNLHRRHFPRLSLNHMYLNKYILHMNMENLRLLHSNVMDNDDCISHIGEYIGIKKEWLKFDKNWYKDQSFKVLREFTCGEDFANEFGNIHGMADTFLASGKYNQINSALKIGRGKLKHLRKFPQIRRPPSWSDVCLEEAIDVINFQRAFLNPMAYKLVEKLNEIAGHSVFGANHFYRGCPPFFSATKFLTEVMEACEQHSYCFETFMNHMEDVAWDENDYILCRSLLECLLLERRLIQANFYMRGHDQLPSALSSYYSGRPLPLLDDDPFLNYPVSNFRKKEEEYAMMDKIKLVGGWLPDVTKVIDALYHAGLATDENLTAIFGDSSMVSYRLYQLRKMDEKKNQSKITSFFSRKRKTMS